MIKLPKNVLFALSLLEKAGFEAFVVGGAVRDSLLGKDVDDFDITTSALPEETEKVFQNFRIIETGLKHGTITVMFQGEPLEITTYRVDGEYKDNRHPETVSFTRNIEDDLSRRDFTVNAIAYNPQKGIVDPFSGVGDLKNKIIRAVGNADKRFDEDALRILRCIRFASVLGFEIEKETSESVRKKYTLLENVSAERIFTELKKLLTGKNVGKILSEYPEVISKIIPELSASIGFDQKNKYHIYDVYTHTVKSIEVSESNLLVRLALLYHDCGKPYVCTTDENGFRHFKGHQKKSAELAETSLERLRCDRKTIDTIKTLVLHHDAFFEPTKKALKRFLTKVSFEEAVLIMKIKHADMATHSPLGVMSEEKFKVYLDLIDEIKREGECVSLKSLNVNGDDLLEIGIPKSPVMGKILNMLLEEVVSETLKNEKSLLLQRAKEIFCEIK